VDASNGTKAAETCVAMIAGIRYGYANGIGSVCCNRICEYSACADRLPVYGPSVFQAGIVCRECYVTVQRFLRSRTTVPKENIWIPVFPVARRYIVDACDNACAAETCIAMIAGIRYGYAHHIGAVLMDRIIQRPSCSYGLSVYFPLEFQAAHIAVEGDIAIQGFVGRIATVGKENKRMAGRPIAYGLASQRSYAAIRGIAMIAGVRYFYTNMIRSAYGNGVIQRTAVACGLAVYRPLVSITVGRAVRKCNISIQRFPPIAAGVPEGQVWIFRFPVAGIWQSAVNDSCAAVSSIAMMAGIFDSKAYKVGSIQVNRIGHPPIRADHLSVHFPGKFEATHICIIKNIAVYRFSPGGAAIPKGQVCAGIFPTAVAAISAIQCAYAANRRIAMRAGIGYG
jgi:hypothetical protein